MIIKITLKLGKESIHMVVHIIYGLIGFAVGLIVIGVLSGNQIDDLEKENFNLKSQIYKLNKKITK